MRITKRRIERAKKLLAKAEELEKQKKKDLQVDQEKQLEEYKKRRAILSTLREQTIKQLVLEFELMNDPLFKAGEKVRINRYNPVREWEGTLTSYLKQCNNDIGPAVVTIIERYIDKSYLREMLETMEEYEYQKMNDIKEDEIEKYMSAWIMYASQRKLSISQTSDKYMRVIGYSYIVEYEGKNLTEKYSAGFREPNFVKLNSEHEKLVLEAYKLELKEDNLIKQKEEIRREKYRIQKKRNEMAKNHPELGLIYICNLPATEEEAMKKIW